VQDRNKELISTDVVLAEPTAGPRKYSNKNSSSGKTFRSFYSLRSGNCSSNQTVCNHELSREASLEAIGLPSRGPPLSGCIVHELTKLLKK